MMDIKTRLTRCCGKPVGGYKCSDGIRCPDCFDKLEGWREIERLREGLSDIVPFILEWEQFYIDENGVKHTSDIVQEIADGVSAKINAILAP